MVVGLSLGGIPSVVILAYGLFVAAPVAPGPSQ
jgi:hypothetical protein